MRVHPSNSNYVEFNGQITPLVGASILSYQQWANSNSTIGNYSSWFTTSQSAGMNVFRIAHRLRHNTNQSASDGIYPYARSATAGNADGLNKWNLDSWNATYWTRLRALVADAAAKGIVVEIGLVSEVNNATNWSFHVYEETNNLNGVGSGVTWDDLPTGRNSGINSRILALVDKTAAELNEYDNWYWEISNEPWAERDAATDPQSQETVNWHNSVIARIITAVDHAFAQQRCRRRTWLYAHGERKQFRERCERGALEWRGSHHYLR